MNGLPWIGLAPLGLVATLWFHVGAQADQPSIAANESACQREKVPTGGGELPTVEFQVPITLVGHKCDGDRCYVVDDEISCEGSNVVSKPVNQPTSEEIEAIFQTDAAPPFVSNSIGKSLGKPTRLPEPPAVVISPSESQTEITELRVLNAELVARLELTQAILQLQNNYTAQILTLERQNAKLVAESAELRVKNEFNEQLTAGLLERTELSAKLAAAHDWISSRTAFEAGLPSQVHSTGYVSAPQYEETIAAIQEDLSNLRRQLPLLKRTPVPFALSGITSQAQTSQATTSTFEPATSPASTNPSCPDAESPCREAESPCREAESPLREAAAPAATPR